MIRLSVREWEYLNVDDGADSQSISRFVADGLVKTAASVQLGTATGDAILVNGHRKLRAQQVVGILVSPAAILEILPKIDGLDEGSTRQNLIHMLAKVYDLKISSGAIADIDWQREDLLEILILLFCDQLFGALRAGLPRRYVDEHEDLPKLRGRLDVQRQFTVLATSPQKLACRYEELSPDMALNQIMKAAVNCLASIARSSRSQRRLKELALSYADVSVIPVSQLPWDRAILDRTNSAWSAVFEFAKLILGRRFQTSTVGDGSGFSLLFEMNTLFEEYVGRVLKRALAGSELSVRLQGPRDFVLAEGSGTRRFATRPDIVVCRGKEVVLIIDTKWKRLSGLIDDPKRGVGQADVYQMIAYSHVYCCSRLMLLYPHHDAIGTQEGILGTYQIRGTEDSTLSIASIAMARLDGIGDRLCSLVESFEAKGSGLIGSIALGAQPTP